jgi:LysR substrate binding domain
VRSLAGEALLHQPSEHAPCYTRRLPKICERDGVTPRALHAVDGLENLLAMVAAGYGIVILPDVFGDTPRAAFRGKRLRLPMPPYQLCAVWLRGTKYPVLKNFLKIAPRLLAATHEESSRPGPVQPKAGFKRAPSGRSGSDFNLGKSRWAFPSMAARRPDRSATGVVPRVGPATLGPLPGSEVRLVPRRLGWRSPAAPRRRAAR